MSNEFMNVPESWPLYDTICLCQNLYGSEADKGFFTSFANFAQKETHSFFKGRTEASVGLEYCNKQSEDNMDFPFIAYSFGVSFFSTGVRPLSNYAHAGAWLLGLDAGMAHWWETEFPRHCAIQLKVQQDIVAELPCMACPPGYGPVGGGASFEHGQINYEDAVNPDYWPVANMSVTQGVPQLNNRWWFRQKIEIPRTATIEAVLHVSDIARYMLNQADGPGHYALQVVGGTPQDPNYFPARFGIQVSLMGKRLVQQRAQYHR